MQGRNKIRRKRAEYCKTAWSKKEGIAGSFFIGLIFGIALGPCIFAYMAPMLGIVFSVISKNINFAVSLVFAYAVGYCSVIVIAGTFAEIVQKYLNWNKKSKGAVILKKSAVY